MQTFLKAAIALVVSLGLVACSSDRKDPLLSVKALPAMLSNKKPPPPVVTGEQITQVLSATDKPASVFAIEASSAQFIMVEIQRNGAYQTFGSSSRQAIVLRNGTIVSTRGFGGDLMSSEEGALLSLVRSKSVGTATYVMRHLTSDNQTTSSTFTCKLDTGPSVPVVLGEVNRKGRAMTATCSGTAGSFTNTYVVDSYGNIISARQWIGDVLGYFNVQPLRL